jgi:hypothetical protein
VTETGIATSGPNITLEELVGYPDTRVPFLFVDPSATRFWENARDSLQRADQSQRTAVARAFAERVRDDPRVREVWYADAEDDAYLTLIVSSATLDEELLFEAALAAVLEQAGQSFPGFLRVYAVDDGVPEIAREGIQLLP